MIAKIHDKHPFIIRIFTVTEYWDVNIVVLRVQL